MVMPGWSSENLPDLLPGFFRLVEPLGGKADIVLGKGHVGRGHARGDEKRMRKYD